ncbi:MAG: type VI secretion system tube protein Hcp [Myxococcales bacterium]|nr:type VI secretion system tube protein Hcp [Myxococcales bacterium]
MEVKGKKQGQFKGESLKDKRKDKWVEGLSFFHEIKSPRDAQTGQQSGKRIHGPITILKEWGPSTPQSFQALCTNEVLPHVRFEFIKTNANGEEYVYHTITLVDATIANIKYTTGTGAEGSASSKGNGQYDTLEIEAISFAYRKITVENIDGKTMGEDDWHAQGG